MDDLQRIYYLHQIITSHLCPVARCILKERMKCPNTMIKCIIRELRLFFNTPIKYDREQNGYFYETT